MSADKCPVCGSDVLYSANGATAYKCGHGMGQKCANAERLAIERGAEVERLTARVAELESFCSKIATGYDHDYDWHKYDCVCRVCLAEKQLGKKLIKSA